MYRFYLHIFITTLVICWPGNAFSQTQPNSSQAQRLMQAVGKILLREKLTHALLDSCSNRYTHLKASSEQSRQKWLDTNQETLDKTRQVQQSIIKNIGETQSVQTVEKFIHNIDNLIMNSVTESTLELENKSKKDRHYVCNRLILTISSGDWDLKHQVPKAVKQITDFK